MNSAALRTKDLGNELALVRGNVECQNRFGQTINAIPWSQALQ